MAVSLLGDGPFIAFLLLFWMAARGRLLWRRHGGGPMAFSADWRWGGSGGASQRRCSSSMEGSRVVVMALILFFVAAVAATDGGAAVDSSSSLYLLRMMMGRDESRLPWLYRQ